MLCMKTALCCYTFTNSYHGEGSSRRGRYNKAQPYFGDISYFMNTAILESWLIILLTIDLNL